MNIGFANIYAFRPHVEQAYYLSLLAKAGGCSTFFLECNGSLSTCYPVKLKDSRKIKECAKCILGGFISYPVKNVDLISSDQDNNPDDDFMDEVVHSSACTLLRTESEHEWESEDIYSIKKELGRPAYAVYTSAKKWIEKNKLDCVIVFNGRIDMTRAVIKACDELGVKYLSHERTWFGNGIQIIPGGNCLSLHSVHKISKEYRNKPLTSSQVEVATGLIVDRFLQKNTLEWRLYNKNPCKAEWPTKTDKKKILVLPSSKNEFAGHPDWMTSWKSNTEALEDLMDAFSISSDQIVIRCHPNWAENIGKASGQRSLQHYKEWAKKKGIFIISSEETYSTYDLIQQSDVVVVNGGSSAVEAGACGKKVICLGPSTHQFSGFVDTFCSKDEMLGTCLDVKNRKDVIRKTLRYVYVRANRYPQFVEFVKAEKDLVYSYYEGAKPKQLINIINEYQISADDQEFSSSEEYEDIVIDSFEKFDWASLDKIRCKELNNSKEKIYVGRRLLFRWIDPVRALFPRGDA